MDHLPIFLDVRNKRVIVGGGGTLAARKAEMVLRAGARVTIHAPEIGAEVKALVRHDHMNHVAAEPTAADLQGTALVYAASEDTEADDRLFQLARAAGVLANIADTPEKCDFIMPAILDRDPMVIAISSSGSSPILARIIKARLESVIPAAYGRLARFVGRHREAVSKRLRYGAERRRFWERILEGPVADMILAGADDQAEIEIGRLLDAAAEKGAAGQAGEVYLVGA
ncbi:MAG: siroheme synthase, partial [Hyphomicrobiales bacterium]|nr:siroheme synthase [Hyphomicrobiales bacterium]